MASTPSKEVLIAKIMGSLNSPISALARTLQALIDNGVEPADIVSGAKAEEAAPIEEAPAAEEVAQEPVAEEVAAEEAPANEEAAEETAPEAE